MRKAAGSEKNWLSLACGRCDSGARRVRQQEEGQQEEGHHKEGQQVKGQQEEGQQVEGQRNMD